MFDKYRDVYLINKATDSSFSLCKVLNKYESDEAATDDLKKLLARKITETDLLRKFDDKEI